MTATATHMNVASSRFAIPQTPNSRQAKDLRSRVNQALQQGDRHLVVDCGAWRQMDLKILSSLIQCASACREHAASFEVTNMSSEVRAGVLALQLGGKLGWSE